jgi:hypothetical protein
MGFLSDFTSFAAILSGDWGILLSPAETFSKNLSSLPSAPLPMEPAGEDGVDVFAE